MMAFALPALAAMEGAAERVGERAEGGLVADPLERVVGVGGLLPASGLAGLAQDGGRCLPRPPGCRRSCNGECRRPPPGARRRERPMPGRLRMRVPSEWRVSSASVDMIIATYCIETGAELLTADHHFAPIRDHLGLRLVGNA